MRKLIATFLLIVVLGGCQGSSPRAPGKLLVVTSIPPYISLVQAIVGDTMTVESVFGSNFDPHTTEVTPSQMKMVQEADLFVGIGEPYENKLLSAMQEGKKTVHVLELNKKIPLLSYSEDTDFVDACQGVDLPSNDGKDLHFWLSPKNLVIQADILIQVLSNLKPENVSLYRQNGEALVEKIKTMHNNLHKTLHPFQGRAVIVSHPVLGYFCHDYHLVQIAVECEGKNPRPQNIHNILQFATSSDAICVFTAPQFNNKGAEAVAEKLNLRVESFDPLSQDVLGTIQHVADAIAK